MSVGGSPHKIGVVSTGGTIANTPQGRVPIEEVVAEVRRGRPDPHPASASDVEVTEVIREGAETFDPSVWARIRDAVQAMTDRDDIHGVVVTHGTFTIEETAYYLHLTVRTDKPLVLTCAQRKHGTLAADGTRNLLDAFAVAESSHAVGLGAVIVVNEEIHCARDVRKVSRRPGGFSSGDLGPLGYVDEDRVVVYRAPCRRHTHNSGLLQQPTTGLPRVGVAATHPGAPTGFLTTLAEETDGLVVQGYAYNGMPAPPQREVLEELAAGGFPVLLVSRGGGGRIPRRDGPFLSGDNLATSKAAVLLTAALAAGLSGEALQQAIDEH